MELVDVQKKERKSYVVTGRVCPETKKFIEENDINVGTLIEVSIKELRKKVKK